VSLAITVPANLVEAWKYEESSGSLIGFRNGKVLIPSTLTYGVAGKIGYAISLDGVMDYAEMASNDSTLDPGLGSKRRAATGANGWYVHMIGDAVFFFIGEGTVFAQETTGTGFMASGTKHLVICRFERSADGMSIRIDNVERGTGQAGGISGPPFNTSSFASVGTTDKLTVGMVRDASMADAPTVFHGENSQDELLFFNTRLTDAECAELWNGGAGVDIVNYLSGAAPTVSSIVPATGVNTGSQAVTILGTNFSSPATPRLIKTGQPDIIASGVTVVDGNTITCTFNLAGVVTGAWDVQVTTPGGSGILPGAFTVTVQPAPTVSTIVPASAPFTAPVAVTITGTNFIAGFTAELTKTGETAIPLTGGVLVDGNTITGTFNITGVANGPWNVEVTTSGGTGILAGGFLVGGLASPTTITPAFGSNKVTVPLVVQIAGVGFVTGNAVILSATGFPDIVASPVVINSAISITATFDLNGKAPGPYTLTVV